MVFLYNSLFLYNGQPTKYTTSTTYIHTYLMVDREAIGNQFAVFVVKNIVREVEMNTVGIDFERVRQSTNGFTRHTTPMVVVCFVRCGVVGTA